MFPPNTNCIKHLGWFANFASNINQSYANWLIWSFSNISSKIYRRSIIFRKFKVSLLHEEKSEIGNKYFVKCYALWLKNGIYAVTNIGVEILMYNQIFILEREFNDPIWSRKTPKKQSKTDMKLTKNPIIVISSSWARYKILKNYVWKFILA